MVHFEVEFTPLSFFTTKTQRKVTVHHILFTAENAEIAEYENTIFFEFIFSLRSRRTAVYHYKEREKS
jgi:hypothetical protein